MQRETWKFREKERQNKNTYIIRKQMDKMPPIQIEECGTAGFSQSSNSIFRLTSTKKI